MRVKFSSLEELQYHYNKDYADEETRVSVEKALDEEVEVYYNENDQVWSEGGILLGFLKEY